SQRDIQQIFFTEQTSTSCSILSKIQKQFIEATWAARHRSINCTRIELYKDVLVEGNASTRIWSGSQSYKTQGHGILSCLGVRKQADLTPKQKKLYYQLKKSERLLTALKKRNAAKSLFGRKQELDVSGGSSVASNICNAERSLAEDYAKTGGQGDYIYKIDGHKIFHLFDIPHFLKCLRNNFMDKDVVFDRERAKWSDIRQLYEFDGTVDAKVTKLSTSRITQTGKEKMWITFAAQVFSRSTYGHLTLLTNTGAMTAGDTAQFILFINDLFDGLNCVQKPSRPLANTNPTCSQFVSAFKTCVINNTLKATKGAKCEDDGCQFLLAINHFLSTIPSSDSVNRISPTDPNPHTPSPLSSQSSDDSGTDVSKLLQITSMTKLAMTVTNKLSNLDCGICLGFLFVDGNSGAFKVGGMLSGTSCRVARSILRRGVLHHTGPVNLNGPLYSLLREVGVSRVIELTPRAKTLHRRAKILKKKLDGVQREEK
ncbi:hypothetical protein CBL_20244, partial [Carabus blaptoides fortunei]